MSTSCFGIIGYPLSHSFSPGWFNAMFDRDGIDARYDAYPLEDIGLLPELLGKVDGLRGLSVTIPYKEKVQPFLHHLDEAAREVGAVNCIDIRSGILTGYNTDIVGFADSLKPLMLEQHDRALVLGNGGAARAVRYVLGNLGIQAVTVSRNALPGLEEQLSYSALTAEMVRNFKLIINTTPLGMYPNTGNCAPIPYEGIGPDHLLYDLVYNPAATLFLSLGKRNGAVTKNGLEMLELQALAAWQIWSRQ